MPPKSSAHPSQSSPHRDFPAAPSVMVWIPSDGWIKFLPNVFYFALLIEQDSFSPLWGVQPLDSHPVLSRKSLKKSLYAFGIISNLLICAALQLPKLGMGQNLPKHFSKSFLFLKTHGMPWKGHSPSAEGKGIYGKQSSAVPSVFHISQSLQDICSGAEVPLSSAAAMKSCPQFMTSVVAMVAAWKKKISSFIVV